jgi:hypothetical protein
MTAPPASLGLLILITLLYQPSTDAYNFSNRLRRRATEQHLSVVRTDVEHQPDDGTSSTGGRHGIGLTYYTPKANRDPRLAPPSLRALDAPSPPPFTSWDGLLRTKTRTGTELSSIPAFVDFCQRHEQVAMKVNNNTRIDPDRNPGRSHIPNQLQGGRNAGPIATTRAGQSVRAGSYYSGLATRARHSLGDTYLHDKLTWVHELQRRLPTIQEELFQVLPYLPDSAWQSLRTRRGKEWSDDTGWAHLALIDNFRRRDDAVAVFPETARILDDVVGTERRMGPRLVAIAKQKARTGIPEHYDYMNWMLTLHTALGGPREGCGIVVDGVRRDWTVGDPVVMDTTFAHETYNESDEDLYLLLVDFWHPDLGVDEIDALRAFFAANSGV